MPKDPNTGKWTYGSASKTPGAPMQFPGRRPFASQALAELADTPRRTQTVRSVSSDEALRTGERASRSGARRYIEATARGLVDSVMEIVKPKVGK